MLHLTEFVFTTLLLVSTAFAAISVTSPTAGASVAAGSATTITWDPATNPGGFTVSIILKQGNPAVLSTQSIAGVIAAGDVPNTGSFSWTVAAGIPTGSNYYVRIQTGVDTDWGGAFGTTDPPVAGGQEGVSGVFTITSSVASVSIESPTISLAATTTTTITTASSTSTTSISTTSTTHSLTVSIPVPTAPAPPSGFTNVVVKNDDPSIGYLPASEWTSASVSAVCNSGSLKVASTVGASINYTFTGDAIYVNTLSSPVGGLFTVTIGGTTTTYDTYSAKIAPSCGLASSSLPHRRSFRIRASSSGSPQNIIMKHAGPSPQAPSSTTPSEVQFDSFTVAAPSSSKQGAASLRVGGWDHLHVAGVFVSACFMIFFV